MSIVWGEDIPMKLSERKASASTPPFSIAMTHSGSFNIEEMYGYKTVLESGYGVDILELLSIIEEAETFADIETADVLK